MKSIVLLALLGLSTQVTETSAIILRSNVDGRFMADISESDDDGMNVQLGDDMTDHSDEFFAAGDQGMTPNGVEYIRTIPD